MDRRTDGQTDRRAGGRAGGRTGGRAGQMNQKAGTQTERLMDGQPDNGQNFDCARAQALAIKPHDAGGGDVHAGTQM